MSQERDLGRREAFCADRSCAECVAVAFASIAAAISPLQPFFEPIATRLRCGQLGLVGGKSFRVVRSVIASRAARFGSAGGIFTLIAAALSASQSRLHRSEVRSVRCNRFLNRSQRIWVVGNRDWSAG